MVPRCQDPPLSGTPEFLLRESVAYVLLDALRLLLVLYELPGTPSFPNPVSAAD